MSSFFAEYPESYFNWIDGKCIYRCDLHFQDATSDKVYIIRVYQNTSTTFVVYKFWGRRGFKLQQDLIQFYNEFPAMNHAFTTIRKKTSRGYKLIHEEKMNTVEEVISEDACSIHHMELFYPSFLSRALLSHEDQYSILDLINDSNTVFESLDFQLYYVVPYGEQWCIFNQKQNFYCHISVHERINIHYFRDINQYVFLACQRNNKYAVFDFVNGENAPYAKYQIRSVQKRPWKERRAMLTEIFTTLYEQEDIYDESLGVYLNDYAYLPSEKRNLLNSLQENSRCIFIRNISSLPSEDILYQLI